jgi:alkanesulfonate monooxygenase SsuD/methylene tetrahydromethanopterin reductase-like flavin-dependent oxidoreductase (luciferase family)
MGCHFFAFLNKPQNIKDMKNIKVGLLDFGIREHKMNSLLRVQDLIEYAIYAEQLDYSRMWLAEHHIGDPTLTWNCPDSLVPIVAGMTERIRIGVAGILIGIHDPYHVACNFKLYNNLYADRIDLGMANGGVSQAVADNTIKADKKEVHLSFERKYREVVHFLNDEDELFEKEQIVIPPFKGISPQVWALGVGYGSSTIRAIETGANLSRSIFHFGSDLNFEKEKLQAFKETFFLKHKRQPQINMVFSGACHETTRKAKGVVKNLKLGYDINLVGCKNLFQDTMLSYQENYGIDEMIFMNVAMKPSDRITSIELINNVLN